MKIQEIQSFLAVCRYGSFTRAAEKIYTTQPTISWHISCLEKELGAPLILRRKGIHEITLTKAGEIFLPQAKKWAALWQETESLLSQNSENTYQLGCVASLSGLIFPQIVEKFHNVFPECSLNVFSRISTDLFEGVESGLYDAAVTCQTYPTRQINVFPLASERLLFVCREDASYGSHVRLADLKISNEIRSIWTDETAAWAKHHYVTDEKPYVLLSSIQNASDFFSFPDAWGLFPATYLPKFPENFRTCELDIEPAPRIFYLASQYPQKQSYYSVLYEELVAFFSQYEHAKLLL